MPVDWSKYPPNWKSEIRPAILKRAGNVCEKCGVKNYAVGARDLSGKWHDSDSIHCMNSDVGYSYFGTFDLKEIRIVLTIAHLDGNTENNDPENLSALCQKCHLSLDAKQHQVNARLTREAKRGLQRMF